MPNRYMLRGMAHRGFPADVWLMIATKDEVLRGMALHACQAYV